MAWLHSSCAAVVRTDKALDKPLDARATNLLSVDTGNGTGSFSDRHDPGYATGFTRKPDTPAAQSTGRSNSAHERTRFV